MSIAMTNEINALKAKVAALESRIEAGAKFLETDAAAEWNKLIERIEALEAHAKTLRLKVRP